MSVNYRAGSSTHKNSPSQYCSWWLCRQIQGLTESATFRTRDEAIKERPKADIRIYGKLWWHFLPHASSSTGRRRRRRGEERRSYHGASTERIGKLDSLPTLKIMASDQKKATIHRVCVFTLTVYWLNLDSLLNLKPISLISRLHRVWHIDFNSASRPLRQP